MPQPRSPNTPQKPHQPPPGKRVDPRDPVEEASNESFPASDPPAFKKSERPGPHRPAGEKPGTSRK